MDLKSTSQKIRLSNYLKALRDMPASGGGGCHPHLLRTANYGRALGLNPTIIFDDLRKFVHGTRDISDDEIVDAIEKAFSESVSVHVTSASNSFRPRSKIPKQSPTISSLVPTITKEKAIFDLIGSNRITES